MLCPSTCLACCLQDALLLDNLEQAHQLCAMHGFEKCIQGGVAVALLVKVEAFMQGYDLGT